MMLRKIERIFIVFTLAVLCILYVPSYGDISVPTIRTLNTLKNYYNDLDGSREERLNLKQSPNDASQAELVIDGHYKIYYADTSHSLMVKYTANGNGNAVRVTFAPVPSPIGNRLSAMALKTCTG